MENEKEKKKIVKMMKNRPKKVFTEAEFEKDIKEIENYYRNEGFVEFKVISSTYVISDVGNAFIKIEVFKGKKYRFGRYEFVGAYLFSSKDDFKKIENAVDFTKGEKFSEEKLLNTIKGIQELYADRGYLNVLVSTSAVFRDDYVDLRFTIIENYPFYVRNIYIEGSKLTKTKVFKREMVQKDEEYCSLKHLDRSCRLFSLSKVRRSQEKIYNLGFIENIDMMINPTEISDEVDLAFDITEGKPGMLTAGAGMSSKDGIMGMMSLSHMNMFGLANKISVNWNFGKRVQDYSFNWTIPWIYDKPASLGLSLFNNRRYRSYSTTYSAYTERRSGGSFFVSPRFEDDKYALRFGYSYERIRVYDVNSIYTQEIAEGTSIQSFVSIEFSRDTRDYIWDPTSGTRFSVGIEVFGGLFGGDVNIYKPTISHSYNKKLFSIGGWPFVFSVANRFGWVKEFSDSDDVPVYERFFLGGADSLRGYNPNGQVGPLE
ncbi:MAG: BamA/OMP85 family outer membrane protein, partial [Elusimicrobiales bacterium]